MACLAASLQSDRTQSAELSNSELIDLLRVALLYLRHHEDIFSRFDEVLSERISSGSLDLE
jgi:hypothetical protein